MKRIMVRIKSIEQLYEKPLLRLCLSYTTHGNSACERGSDPRISALPPLPRVKGNPRLFAWVFAITC